MKTIYLYLHASALSDSSVQAKIVDQINAARRIGIDIEGCFFSFDSEIKLNHEGINFILVTPPEGRFFKSWKYRKFMHIALHNFLSKRNVQEEAYFLRYAYPNYSLLGALQIIKKRYILNHVCAEVKEIKQYKSASESWIARLLGNMEYKIIPIINDFIFGSFVRGKAAGAIVNSTDIAQHQQCRTFGKYETMIVADGVDVQSVKMSKRPVFSDTLNMVFLKGASTEASYNGLDRIIKGIKNYNGSVKITLSIYGNELSLEKELIEKYNAGGYVFLQPFMSRHALNEEFKKYHLGVGQLAIHRKGLISNSTIKTREYFARGLPFIYGHHDVDFSLSDEAKRFCLELPAEDKEIDMEAVLNFAKSTLRIDNLEEKMKQFSERNLDYTHKMQKIVSFIMDRIL